MQCFSIIMYQRTKNYFFTKARSCISVHQNPCKSHKSLYDAKLLVNMRS
jgi:hypothetical protein